MCLRETHCISSEALRYQFSGNANKHTNGNGRQTMRGEAVTNWRFSPSKKRHKIIKPKGIQTAAKKSTVKKTITKKNNNNDNKIKVFLFLLLLLVCWLRQRLVHVPNVILKYATRIL